MKVFRYAWSDYVTEKHLRREHERIESLGDDVRYHRADRPGSLPSDSPPPTVLITNSQHPVNGELLTEVPNLDLVITTTSGCDHVDLEACRRREVLVARTPRSRAGNVVNHTVAMLSSLLRTLPETTRRLRQTRWDRTRTAETIHNLRHLTVGVLGWGVIGERVTSRLRGRTKDLLVHDPFQRSRIDRAPGITGVDFDQLVERSNVLTLHAPLTERTRDLIDRSVLETLPDPAYLLNTARGELVVWKDLIGGLTDRRLAGAGIDVFREEPFRKDAEWPDNLILSPHSAGFGPNLADSLLEETVETLRSFRSSGTVPHPVRIDQVPAS